MGTTRKQGTPGITRREKTKKLKMTIGWGRFNIWKESRSQDAGLLRERKNFRGGEGETTSSEGKKNPVLSEKRRFST